MPATSLRFRSVCEEDFDNVWTTSRFILKQLDYQFSISMRDSWLGLHLRQLREELSKCEIKYIQALLFVPVDYRVQLGIHNMLEKID